jgi:two-component system chemotaxis sensor kinase CheA
MDASLEFDDELLAEFVNESREHLTTIESDLLAIEERGADIDSDLVNKVFRAAHSIKGASSFFGFTKVKELSHCAETVLDMVRSGTMIPNAEIINLLLAAFDQLRQMINRPAESGNTDIDELVIGLTGLTSSFLPEQQKASLTQTISLTQANQTPVELSEFDYLRLKDTGHFFYNIEFDLIHDVELRGRNVLDVFRSLYEAGDILNCEVNFDAVGTLDDSICTILPLRLLLATLIEPAAIDSLFPRDSGKVTYLSDPTSSLGNKKPLRTGAPEVSKPDFVPPAHVEVVSTQKLEAVAPLVSTKKISPTAVSPTTDPVLEDSIRVNVGTLEMLMNLAGELVLGRNQLRASIALKDPRALKAADQRINQITSELQDVVMQTRLQPIGNVFTKFPRLVRDLSATLHKDIQLDIRGKEVALDRSLIESLSDPLTHMVRNAVDHGIELPDERLRSGKEPQGLITIDARHEAGQVVVEISDNGKGIDPERVGKAALAKGLITADRLEGMSSKDKMALIFLPGLSTTKQITDISGRGVGMDVVKTNLDHLGGKVEITSTVGKGTTFRIKLPLTLAIIPSLIVSVEGERFCIPQINVEEIRHVVPGQAKTRIEVVADAEVLLLRDRLIPLLRFSEILGIVPTYTEPGEDRREVDRRTRLSDRRSRKFSESGEQLKQTPSYDALHSRETIDRRRKGGALEIVVVTTGTQTYGLVVGKFHDTEEIVVKPLGSHLKGLEEYAGATILGDGSVALILDVAGLANKANLDALVRRTRARTRAQEEIADQTEHSQSLVLFHNSPGTLCGVPLDAVTRIEHIAHSQVETIGGRRTMQYHGGLLPIVTLSDVAQVEPIADDMELAVMIANIRGHEIGLLGAMPVDVIETNAQINETAHRQKGVAGSTIIRNRTALIVDLAELVDASWPEWAEQQTIVLPTVPDADDSVVLLAEDSDFFRAQVTRFIKDDGYTIIAAKDGEAAWELLLENLSRVRVVVTDIEMPRLDGLGFARRIRADHRTSHLPIIALTSLAGDDDIARVKEAGINDYQTKIDREQLLERLREYWRTATSKPEKKREPAVD